MTDTKLARGGAEGGRPGTAVEFTGAQIGGGSILNKTLKSKVEIPAETVFSG